MAYLDHFSAAAHDLLRDTLDIRGGEYRTRRLETFAQGSVNQETVLFCNFYHRRQTLSAERRSKHRTKTGVKTKTTCLNFTTVCND